MNYEYLQYWIESMKDIKLLEQLMEENLYMYQRTQDMLYLEYIINNIKEISRLRHLVKRYYNKILKISYSPTTLPSTTLPLS